MKKKLYLQPEVRVFVVRHTSVLAASSPTPAPKVICDFDEYEFGEDFYADEDDVLF